jgi:hypothetical protein
MRVKKTLSVDTDFLEKAERLRSLLRYPDVSSLVEQLIREEWERRIRLAASFISTGLVEQLIREEWERRHGPMKLTLGL